MMNVTDGAHQYKELFVQAVEKVVIDAAEI